MLIIDGPYAFIGIFAASKGVGIFAPVSLELFKGRSIQPFSASEPRQILAILCLHEQ